MMLSLLCSYQSQRFPPHLCKVILSLWLKCFFSLFFLFVCIFAPFIFLLRVHSCTEFVANTLWSLLGLYCIILPFSAAHTAAVTQVKLVHYTSRSREEMDRDYPSAFFSRFSPHLHFLPVSASSQQLSPCSLLLPLYVCQVAWYHVGV